MSDEEIIQKECHIGLAGFEDLARLACAHDARPRRVYSFVLDGRRVASIILTLADTLVVLHAPLPKDGGYVSYRIDAGREYCDVTDTASSRAANAAPIIHLKSSITRLGAAGSPDEIPNVFDPVELCDMGSLARLIYDPDFPDEPDLALYAVPVDDAWILGRPMMFGLDRLYHAFYYVRLAEEPSMPFLGYGHDSVQEPRFADRVADHGSVYMPIVKLKDAHPIFGLGSHGKS